jgi:hypothetical protein
MNEKHMKEGNLSVFPTLVGMNEKEAKIYCNGCIPHTRGMNRNYGQPSHP